MSQPKQWLPDWPGPRPLHEKLKIVAAREGVSLNAYVANVLAKRVAAAG